MDPVAWEAAWHASGTRWHGSACAETREIFDGLPAGRAELEFAAMMAQRAEIEKQAGRPTLDRTPASRPGSRLAATAGREISRK